MSSPIRKTRSSASMAMRQRFVDRLGEGEFADGSVHRARVLGGVDVAQQIGGRGRRARLREGDALGDFPLGFGARSPRSRRSASRPSASSSLSKRAIGSRAFHASISSLRAIAVAVGARMAARAIGLALDQRRPLAAPRALGRLERGLGDRGEIVAVDDDAGHRIAAGALRRRPGTAVERAVETDMP